MSKYEPINTDEPGAEPLYFFCDICKKFNCDHWIIDEIQVKKSSSLWGLITPTTLISCKIRCVTCDKDVHHGKLGTGPIACQGDSRHWLIHSPDKPYAPREDHYISLASRKKVAAAPPGAKDTKTAAAAKDTKTAAAPPGAKDTKTALEAVKKKVVIFQDETVMCDCMSKFTIDGGCEHWAISKSPKEKHEEKLCELWCKTCDPKHEKTPLRIGGTWSIFLQKCPTCTNRAWTGVQHMTQGHILTTRYDRPDCKKCRGDGWIVAPEFITCPMCAGTGGLACACAKESSGACSCVAGYKKRCQVCDGQRAVERAAAAAVRCPFCRAV